MTGFVPTLVHAAPSVEWNTPPPLHPTSKFVALKTCVAVQKPAPPGKVVRVVHVAPASDDFQTFPLCS